MRVLALIKSSRFQAIAAGLLAGVVIVVLAWGGYRAFKAKPASPKPPALITMSLISNPSAPISVDGKVAGSSPVTIHLNAGSHIISSSLPGYRVESIPVQVDGHTRNLTIQLQPLPLRFQLLTDQPKAKVSLDDQMIGTTGDDGGLVTTILPGNHSLSVEARRTSKVSFHFVPGQLASANDLSPNTNSTLFFFAGFNGKAQAQCNCRPSKVLIGNQHTDLDSGDWKLDLPMGEYPVSLEDGKTLSVAVTADPSATLAIFTSGKARLETETVDALLQRAEGMYNQSNYRAADDLVRQILSREPNHEAANALKQKLDHMDATIPFRSR